MKQVSKFLFNFFDILESKVFTEGILGISFCHSIIQKTLRTDRKHYIFTILGGLNVVYNQANYIWTNPSVKTYNL